MSTELLGNKIFDCENFLLGFYTQVVSYIKTSGILKIFIYFSLLTFPRFRSESVDLG